MAQLKSTNITGNLAVTGKVLASEFIKLGGTGSQFLMADGSVKTLSEAGGIYTLPEATSSILGGVKIGSNISVSNGVISLTQTNVTAALGYTPPTVNTTYGNASQSAAGLMSANDKKKLDGIASSANNYTLPTATDATLGGIKTGFSASGANIPLKVSSEKGYVTLTSNAVIAALGYTPPTVNTTYGNATTSTAGLMSPTDKNRLDTLHTNSGKINVVTGANPTAATTAFYPLFSTTVSGTTAAYAKDSLYIYTDTNGNQWFNVGNSSKTGALTLHNNGNGYVNLQFASSTSANFIATFPAKTGTVAMTTDIPAAYTLPQATSSTLGGVKIGSNISVSNGVISLSKNNVTTALGYTPPTVNTTYVNATTSAAGLMSAGDKAKLDSIDDNANNFTYTLPAATQTTLGGVKIWITDGTTLNISTN